MEGSVADKPCEWCHDSNADYEILKWNIEVRNLHTNKLHRDNGPLGILYLCADCLAYNGYIWDKRT